MHRTSGVAVILSNCNLLREEGERKEGLGLPMFFYAWRFVISNQKIYLTLFPIEMSALPLASGVGERLGKEFSTILQHGSHRQYALKKLIEFGCFSEIHDFQTFTV